MNTGPNGPNRDRKFSDDLLRKMGAPHYRENSHSFWSPWRGKGQKYSRYKWAKVFKPDMRNKYVDELVEAKSEKFKLRAELRCTEEERDILKSRAVLCIGVRVKHWFINDHWYEHGIATMNLVSVVVSISGCINRALAIGGVFDYIESNYNRTRRRSHLGGISPEASERVVKYVWNVPTIPLDEQNQYTDTIDSRLLHHYKT